MHHAMHRSACNNSPMQMIVRTRDNVKHGLHHRYVFGLNILSANGVDTPVKNDPRIVFLSSLSMHNSCAAHTGNLYDFADTPGEFFGSVCGNACVPVSTGVYGGKFYDVKTWDNFPACFFSEVPPSFWEASTDDGESNIVSVISRDALALYVRDKSDSSHEVQAFLNEPFSDDRWLRSMSGHFKLVVTTEADGWYFSIYSRSISDFDLLTSALTLAVRSVEETAWFQQHSATLTWDDEYELCLMRPELIRSSE